jgi:hypothetical protein
MTNQETKMRLYDLFEIAEWEGKQDTDPIHRTVDLWRGVDVAERHLGFSFEDLALMFRHYRQGTIWRLFPIGQHFRAWASDDPKIRGGACEVVLSPEVKAQLEPMVAGLREVLRKAKERNAQP